MVDQKQEQVQQNFKLNFQTHPDRYKHLKIEIQGPIARMIWNIQEDGGARPGYSLKLNSYDISVDIELADAVNRLRFEHPEVSTVCLESGRDDIFCAGANIYMLSQSTHCHKVNFCKFTNETRINIEEATEKSGQCYVASLKGGTAGGGYELAMACAEIFLIDDRKSSVSLPETPLLGVLPGTGGLTRLVDKRKVRRDLADLFCTTAEGVRGQKAKDWKLVDQVYPPSAYSGKLQSRLEELAGKGHPDRKGIELTPLEIRETEKGLEYQYVSLQIEGRLARVTLKGPSGKDSQIPEDPSSLGANWYGLKMWRELADCLYHLRFNWEEVGLVEFHSTGDLKAVLALDEALYKRKDHWFIREVLLHMGRVLKLIDVSAKSFFSFITPGSCFGGSLFEIALGGDRIYMLDNPDEENSLALSSLNGGELLMFNKLSRLENRFYQDKKSLSEILSQKGKPLSPQQASELGLVTEAMDDIDWDDEVRVAIEERLSLSPDALTGMEANLRFVGPETMETRIFGRLSPWQNWIFIRPNATGEKGALTSYGKATSPEFDWRRT